MLKTALILFFLLAGVNTHAQPCSNCGQRAYIYYKFIALRHRDIPLKVYHNVVTYTYRKDEEDAKNKHGEDYRYIHNGDYLKGAEDVFTSNVQGSGWLKNFDFGKFANIFIEVSPDTHNQPGASFAWSGQLIFFKLIHKKTIRVRRSYNDGVPYRGGF